MLLIINMKIITLFTLNAAIMLFGIYSYNIHVLIYKLLYKDANYVITLTNQRS